MKKILLGLIVFSAYCSLVIAQEPEQCEYLKKEVDAFTNASTKVLSPQVVFRYCPSQIELDKLNSKLVESDTKIKTLKMDLEMKGSLLMDAIKKLKEEEIQQNETDRDLLATFISEYKKSPTKMYLGEVSNTIVLYADFPETSDTLMEKENNVLFKVTDAGIVELSFKYFKNRELKYDFGSKFSYYCVLNETQKESLIKPVENIRVYWVNGQSDYFPENQDVFKTQFPCLD